MEQGAFDISIKKHATTEDTLDLIIRTAVDYSHHGFTQECAKLLCPPGADNDTCLHNIFNYYCRNIDYILDDNDIEKVWTPARTVSEGEGDCKKAATFIASVLLAANRPGLVPVFKWVMYKDNDKYTHIYVIVPKGNDLENYTTLDPTNDCQYNKEVTYQTGTLYFIDGTKMELRQMGSSTPGMESQANRFSIPWSQHITAETDEIMSGIDDIGCSMMGAVTTTSTPTLVHKGTVPPEHAAVVAQLTKGSPKLAASLNNIPLVNQRGALLQLIEKNGQGIATQLALVLGKNPDALTPLWKTVGGDEDHLKQIVLAGAKLKPDMSISGNTYINGPSIGEMYTEVTGDYSNLTWQPSNGNYQQGISVTQALNNPASAGFKANLDKWLWANARGVSSNGWHDWANPDGTVFNTTLTEQAFQNMYHSLLANGGLQSLPPINMTKQPAKGGLLHAAAGILKVVAPIANLVVPGAGALIDNIAGDAEQIATLTPVSPVNAAQIVATLPVDPTGMNDTSKHFVQTKGVSHGSFYSPIGFFFKCCFLQLPFHTNHTLCVLLQVAMIAPLMIWGYKKLFK